MIIFYIVNVPVSRFLTNGSDVWGFNRGGGGGGTLISYSYISQSAYYTYEIYNIS